MRKEFRRVLREQFRKGLLGCDNGFSEFKGKSAYLLPGNSVFIKKPSGSNIWLVVILIPDEKREAFTLEIGWSALSRFPELAARPSGHPTSDRHEFHHQEFIFRLHDLYDRRDSDWKIQPDFDPFTGDFLQFVKDSMKPISPEEAAMLVIPKVDDAIARLKQYGFPYLDEYVRSTLSKSHQNPSQL